MREFDRSISHSNGRVVYGYCIGVGKKQSLSLTVSAAYVSSHPKTAVVQLAHTRNENFGEGKNWLGLSECMNGQTRVVGARFVLREAHGPLLAEESVEIRVNVNLHVRMCERENAAHYSRACALHEPPLRSRRRRYPRGNSHL